MMNKKEAGRLGGLATVKKYGNEYMTAIAKRGANAFHAKYVLIPIRLNDFAITHRLTGEIVNTVTGRPV
jgi:hypothetical protein